MVTAVVPTMVAPVVSTVMVADDCPLAEDLEFARAVAFVHGPEFVATAPHAVVSDGYRGKKREKESSH